ncbi:MAG: Mov34/MPN/PAD-1 family protein [Phycisphaeraceae bacterium]
MPDLPEHIATESTVWLSRSVLKFIVHNADHHHPEETGGVLLGYWINDGTDVVITKAVGPGPEAGHRRYGFTPDHQYQEQEIARFYEASGRRLGYLGDWHSHPEGPTKLSRRDCRTLKRIARFGPARNPWPIMLILGNHWNVGLWQAKRSASCLPWRTISLKRAQLRYFNSKNPEADGRTRGD